MCLTCLCGLLLKQRSTRAPLSSLCFNRVDEFLWHVASRQRGTGVQIAVFEKFPQLIILFVVGGRARVVRVIEKEGALQLLDTTLILREGFALIKV